MSGRIQRRSWKCLVGKLGLLEKHIRVSAPRDCLDLRMGG